jgi:hypothetical protein
MAAAWLPLALALLGFWGRKLEWFTPSGARTLHQYVIRIALPALVLTKVTRLEWQPDLWLPAAIAWLAVALGIGWAWLLGHWLGLAPRDRNVLALMVALGNTSFLGIPLIESTLGKDGVAIAILYDQLGSFLALALLGQWLLANPEGRAGGWRSTAFRIVSFPPFVALLMAGLLNALSLGGRWLTPLEPVGSSLVPVIMVALGIQFQWSMPREERQWLWWGLIGKMLVIPSVFLCAAAALGLDGITIRASVLEAAMPPMMSAAALVGMAGYRERLASAMVAWGALAAFLTIPAWAWLAQRLL